MRGAKHPAVVDEGAAADVDKDVGPVPPVAVAAAAKPGAERPEEVDGGHPRVQVRLSYPPLVDALAAVTLGLRVNHKVFQISSLADCCTENI